MLAMIIIIKKTTVMPQHTVDPMFNLNDFREFSIEPYRSPLSMLLDVSHE
jgi:hypothetical protein